MNWLRWIVTTILSSISTLLYSVFVGLASAMLFPDVIRHYHSRFEHEPVIGAALQSALDWGLLATMLMGPCLGFTLVRDFNAFLDTPSHEKGFWRAVLRSLAFSFILIGAIGFGLCGLVALAIWIQGGGTEQISVRAFFTLMLGHAAAGLIVAVGHFVRNPPDLSLGSGNDQRIAGGGPPHR